MTVLCPKCGTLYQHDSLVDHPMCRLCGTQKREPYIDENRQFLLEIGKLWRDGDDERT